MAPKGKGAGRRGPRDQGKSVHDGPAQKGSSPNGDAPQGAGKSKFAIINSKICQAADAGDLNWLLDVAAANLNSMSLVNISTAMQKLARLHKQDNSRLSFDDPRFSGLLQHIVRTLTTQLDREKTQTSPRCWSTITWSLASISARGPMVFNIFVLISRLSEACLDMFKPLELGNVLWAFAKVAHPNRGIFDAAEAHIRTHMQSFRSRNSKSTSATPSPDADVNWSSLSSTLLWAFAVMQFEPSPVMYHLADEYHKQVDHKAGCPLEISNFLWAVATLKMQPEMHVLKTVGDKAATVVKKFEIQELATSAWAFSSLGVRHDVFFQAVLSRLQNTTTQLRPHSAMQMFTALEHQARLGAPVPKDLDTSVFDSAHFLSSIGETGEMTTSEGMQQGLPLASVGGIAARNTSDAPAENELPSATHGIDELPMIAQVAYSIKNTFLHVEAAADVEARETVDVKALPPPLTIIPSAVSPEKLEHYRQHYQRFRAGDAVGAKGEVSDATSCKLTTGCL